MPMEVSWVITRATPLAPYIIPAVMMKNGTFSQAMQKPFSSPHPVPMASAITDAGMVDMPPCIRRAATQPTKAAIDATDRSIRPLIITKVIPQPNRIYTAAVRSGQREP